MDGMDITACRNVFISDCDIAIGDDAICIKSENPENMSQATSNRTAPSHPTGCSTHHPPVQRSLARGYARHPFQRRDSPSHSIDVISEISRCTFAVREQISSAAGELLFKQLLEHDDGGQTHCAPARTKTIAHFV